MEKERTNKKGAFHSEIGLFNPRILQAHVFIFCLPCMPKQVVNRREIIESAGKIVSRNDAALCWNAFIAPLGDNEDE